MKVILSRKGFDSANGGIVSPVFPNGKMLSFPIPSKDTEKDSIRYSDLTSDYYGKPFQAIWGYMQIGKIITDPSEIMEYKWHPHACAKRNNPNGEDKNNTLKNCAKDGEGIYYSGIWQELVLENAEKAERWAESLF